MDRQQFAFRGRPLTDPDLITSLQDLGVCDGDILYCAQAFDTDDDVSSWTLGSPRSQVSSSDWVILNGSSQRERDDDIEMTGLTDSSISIVSSDYRYEYRLFPLREWPISIHYSGPSLPPSACREPTGTRCPQPYRCPP